MLGLSLHLQTAASLGNPSIGPLAPALGHDLALSSAQLGLIALGFARLAGDPSPRPSLSTREA